MVTDAGGSVIQYADEITWTYISTFLGSDEAIRDWGNKKKSMRECKRKKLFNRMRKMNYGKSHDEVVQSYFKPIKNYTELKLSIISFDNSISLNIPSNFIVKELPHSDDQFF